MDKKFLPKSDREYLEAKSLQFLENVDTDRNGLILPNYSLPDGKYNYSCSTLLIILPPGFSDVPPDMFYFNPTILLTSTNALPEATSGTINFNGISWQAWSRHFPPQYWRSGIDGIHTYLQIINDCLRLA